MLRARLPRRLGAAGSAALLWGACFCVVMGLVLTGTAPTLSYRVYEAAGQRWLAGERLYETVTLEGFQYFPQSAMLLAPFAWLGNPWGDLAWRAIWWGSSAWGTWRCVRTFAPTRPGRLFLASTCLAVGPSIGSLSNGQANLAIASLTLHVAADLIARRWWMATAVLTLGLAVKPLMLVVLLLACGLYPALRWRSACALPALFGLPWLLSNHASVIAEYSDCIAKMSLSANAGPRYENLRGLFAQLGWNMPNWVAFAAALATFALCLRVKGGIRQPHATLVMVGFTNAYLMLFNPRTQSTSYALTGSVAALLAAFYTLHGRKVEASAMVLVSLAWTVNYHWWGFAGIQYWLKPLACIAFVAVLVRDTFMASIPAAAESGTPAMNTIPSS